MLTLRHRLVHCQVNIDCVLVYIALDFNFQIELRAMWHVASEINS